MRSGPGVVDLKLQTLGQAPIQLSYKPVIPAADDAANLSHRVESGNWPRTGVQRHCIRLAGIRTVDDLIVEGSRRRVQICVDKRWQTASKAHQHRGRAP